jgi:hypothetical protein
MLCLHHMHHGFSWWYIGDSLQADRRFHVCRRGGGRGETMPARQTRGGGGKGTLARVYISHRRLWRKEGRLDQAREGRTGGRGCRKSFRDVRKVNLLG